MLYCSAAGQSLRPETIPPPPSAEQGSVTLATSKDLRDSLAGVANKTAPALTDKQTLLKTLGVCGVHLGLATCGLLSCYTLALPAVFDDATSSIPSGVLGASCAAAAAAADSTCLLAAAVQMSL